MGFRGFTPEAPRAEIDATPVLEISETIGGAGVFGPVTVSAADLDGANAIMFVHSSAGNNSTWLFDMESDATTGVVASTQQWGQHFNINTAFVKDVWDVPVILPLYGGDLRLTVTNALPLSTREVNLTGYALRGAAVPVQPLRRGFFDPGASTGVEARMFIPVIPPQYRWAQIWKIGFDPADLSTQRHIVGKLNPDAVGDDRSAFSTRAVLPLTEREDPNWGEWQMPIAGLAALDIGFEHAEVTPPSRLGFVITLIP